MNRKPLLIPLALLLFSLVASCERKNLRADGYGNFEATEVIISAEATGKVEALGIREGMQVRENDTIGKINCTGLQLEKERILAALEALEEKTVDQQPEIAIFNAQIEASNKTIATLQEKMNVLRVEQIRVKNLVKDEAAPSKNLDDINGQIAILQKEIETAESKRAVIEQQLESTQSRINDQNTGILAEQKPLEKQIARIEDQLNKCTLISPVAGKVLEVYIEPQEFASIGRPLYKVADLDVMELRVYLSATQLPKVTTGQTVEVRVDDQKDMRSLPGTITWISSEAEFTPKVIQTREERVNLVYAATVEVTNDGSLKIGMPAEMWFSTEE